MSNIVNIICDDRLDRMIALREETLRVKGFKVNLWPIVEDKDSVVASINKSHKQIVAHAKLFRKPYILIGEDDVYFPSENGFEYFLSKMPERFDIYSSATYANDIHNKNILCGFHLYAVAEKFYDTFLSVPDDVHIDTYISDMGGEFYVCRPFAALQRAGWSANNKAFVNYNAPINPEMIYQ